MPLSTRMARPIVLTSVSLFLVSVCAVIGTTALGWWQHRELYDLREQIKARQHEAAEIQQRVDRQRAQHAGEIHGYEKRVKVEGEEKEHLEATSITRRKDASTGYENSTPAKSTATNKGSRRVMRRKSALRPSITT